MAISDDPNQRHYFKECNPEEFDSFCNKLSAHAAEINLWAKGRPEQDVETFDIQSIKERELALKPKGGLLKKIMSSNLINKDVCLKFDNQKINYFTTGILRFDKETRTYLFKLGEMVYISQQRSNYRLSASHIIKIQIKIEGEVFDGLDISAGGTSILVDNDRLDEFSKGRILENCVLRFMRQKFTITQAKVVRTWEKNDEQGNPYERVKVGLSFINMPKDTEEELFKQINAEARAEEIRKKFASP